MLFEANDATVHTIAGNFLVFVGGRILKQNRCAVCSKVVWDCSKTKCRAQSDSVSCKYLSVWTAVLKIKRRFSKWLANLKTNVILPLYWSRHLNASYHFKAKFKQVYVIKIIFNVRDLLIIHAIPGAKTIIFNWDKWRTFSQTNRRKSKDWHRSVQKLIFSSFVLIILQIRNERTAQKFAMSLSSKTKLCRCNFHRLPRDYKDFI